MGKHLVTVVTPAFNCENTIEDTFNSLVSQTFSDFEWLIIDDHSSDNTFQVISKLAKRDTRIIVLQTNKNSGAAVARNIGIEAANGRFIAFLDADDFWKPNKLEVQMKFMQDNDCAFSFSAYDVLYQNGKTKEFMPKHDTETYKKLLRSCNIGCLTVMIDTTKIGKIYMPTDTPKREDYATWLDITKKGVEGLAISESLAIYRITEGSVSNKKLSLLTYHYNVYRKHENMSLFKSHFYLIIHSFNKIFKKY